MTDAEAAPTLEEQFDALIADLDAVGREIQAIESQRDADLEARRLVAEQALEDPKRRQLELAKQLWQLFKPNRSLLLKGKDKSHAFPLGRVGERTGNFSVVVENLDQVLRSLRRLGLLRKFGRLKWEINTQAILDARQTEPRIRHIKGLVIKPPGTNFYVEPKDGKRQSWPLAELDPPPSPPQQLQFGDQLAPEQ